MRKNITFDVLAAPNDFNRNENEMMKIKHDYFSAMKNTRLTEDNRFAKLKIRLKIY